MSFAPTPQTPRHEQHIQLLKHYDNFAKTVRRTYVHLQYQKPNIQQQFPNPPIEAQVYRALKFLPKQHHTTLTETYSGVGKVEQYIERTKQETDEQIPRLLSCQIHNVTSQERQIISNFKKSKSKITIKPADKNLGVVILNTDDYIHQCMIILSDTNTYRQTQFYPEEEIKKKLINLLVTFKSHLLNVNKNLYDYLQPKNNQQTPQMYGLPKIHKKFDHLPPLRPIVSQCSSLLNPTARLIDHCLQPLAQSYPDYLHNSTTLSLILEDLHVPDESILVAIDVESLYPSIPQNECLNVIYEEMHKQRHLMLLEPNFLTRLLHLNVNYNYFEFGTLTFQQIHGTAMGAAFSPTIANIYMSIFLKKFLMTQQYKPLLLKRYIDDILILWTDTEEKLQQFLKSLNEFHPTLNFTFNYSKTSTDFLDLTIYKGPHFMYTNRLDTKTFQKQQNLYQYVHFTSNHPKSLHKALIKGECIRYIRTNTVELNYNTMVHVFKKRLKKRDYPVALIEKTIHQVTYKDRNKFLTINNHKPTPYKQRPIFKCLLPPQFTALQHLILKDYKVLNIPTPRFILLGHKTLKQELTRTRIHLTDEQIIDIAFTREESLTPTDVHNDTAKLPMLRYKNVRTEPCRHPRCTTCRHLNCEKCFKSTKTGKTYPLRHHFTCTSKNVIYLITCTKCKKQYVGMTTQQVNTRLNHHRSNIFNKVRTYVSNHFNFPDHTIQNLTIQIIDTVRNGPNMYQELKVLERYWINTLRTIQPLGLNVSAGKM